MSNITILGEVCSAIQCLPTSVVLREGLLEYNDRVPVRVSTFTRTWEGLEKLPGGSREVAITSFALHNPEHLERVKKVRIFSKNIVLSPIQFTDASEIGTLVEETNPREHPTLPWRLHGHKDSTFPCLRLGKERQHHRLHKVES